MLYRATRWKLEGQDFQAFKQGMVSLSRRRPSTKRLVKVDIPVPIVDQREVVFCHFTKIGSIDRERKNKRAYHLKHQKSNNFLAWLGMSANDSSATVVSGCDPTGVSASTEVYALTIYTTPNRLLVFSNRNVSKINERMKILEITGYLELCTSLTSNNIRPMTVMTDIEHDPTVEDCDSEMTQPTRKGLIKQVDSIDLMVAMLKVLSLEDKRKIKESEKEHFETFQVHRPYSRPYAKRMKVSNN